MKLLAVLLLCSQLFSSRADPLLTEDASCSDPIIFHAVNMALRSYNAEKKNSNQFALYQITDAKATVGNDTYFVSYKVFETSCEAQSNKSWQECDYKPESEAQRGQCTAQVYINKPEKIDNILHQDCNIIPAESPVVIAHTPCLGCPQSIPVNSSDLLVPLRSAVQKFNNESEHPFLFEFGEINNATRQVVAGWIYVIDYLVKETNCSKNDFLELNPFCKHQENGVFDICKAKVFINIWNAIIDVQQTCIITGDLLCPDCTVPVDTDSQDLEEPMRYAIEKFNSEFKHNYYYNLEYLQKAKTQEVPGTKYQFTLQMKETDCAKDLHETLHEDCKFKDNGVPGRTELRASKKDKQYCSVMIHIMPGKEIDSKINCITLDTRSRTVIPGLSPFRSVKGNIEVGNSGLSLRKRWVGQGLGLGPMPGQNQGHGHGHEHGRGHGHGNGHQHEKKQKKDKKDKKDKDKRKDDKKKGESSEESEESGPVKPQIVTTLVPSSVTSKLEESTPTPDPVTKQPDVVTAISISVVFIDDESTTMPPTEDIVAVIPDLPLEPESPLLNLPDEFSLDLPAPVLPLCPGNLWKAAAPLNNNPKIHNGPAETSPVIEKNESVDSATPATPGTFSDADLLP
ncbi:kininogen-1 [Rhinatrema bivittatum]|uniref:kininogen-1 n=1 Tax=Rhinatrema bivittatum TaxID=194408 RepID=UPI00112B6587|nr:kininogen-1 [Rhinatrema bivittatum]